MRKRRPTVLGYARRQRPRRLHHRRKGRNSFPATRIRPNLGTMRDGTNSARLLVDDAAERCGQTRCCVAVLGKDISQRASAFITQNYLPITSQLRVVGAWLQRSTADEHRFEFATAIPASYEVVGPDGVADGVLDGVPCHGPRFLSPGLHTFEFTGPRRTSPRSGPRPQIVISRPFREETSPRACDFI